MEEYMQHFWHIMLYYFKKDRNATEMQKKKKDLCSDGEGAVTDQMCQKWFVELHAGHFSLEAAPWSGRPVEVESDQIKTLIVSNQCFTTQKIANILKISKSIKLLVKWKMCLLFYGKS